MIMPLHERHSNFTADTFVLDCQSTGEPLRVSVKRYVPSFQDPCPATTQQESVILLLAHAAGFHKEQWEPTLSHLFALQRQLDSPSLIREAWALDCQDHGDSAVLNAAELLKTPRAVSCYDYGRAFVSLLKSGYVSTPAPGADIVFIGHSAGAVSGILATSYYTPPTNIPFKCLILVEPSMISQKLMATRDEARTLTERVVRASRSRRDVWPNRQSARTWFSSKAPWASWDTQVLDLFLEHGLLILPSILYPNESEGVGLKCSRTVQSRAHSNISDQYDALHRLSQICQDLPVHVIFGARNDYFSKEVQDVICDRGEGRVMTSINYLPDTGHMAVQESPKQVAEAIWRIIEERFRAHTAFAKL